MILPLSPCFPAPLSPPPSSRRRATARTRARTTSALCPPWRRRNAAACLCRPSFSALFAKRLRKSRSFPDPRLFSFLSLSLFFSFLSSPAAMARLTPLLLSLALVCGAHVARAAPGDHTVKCATAFDCDANCQTALNCYLACVPALPFLPLSLFPPSLPIPGPCHWRRREGIGWHTALRGGRERGREGEERERRDGLTFRALSHPQHSPLFSLSLSLSFRLLFLPLRHTHTHRRLALCHRFRVVPKAQFWPPGERKQEWETGGGSNETPRTLLPPRPPASLPFSPPPSLSLSLSAFHYTPR